VVGAFAQRRVVRRCRQADTSASTSRVFVITGAPPCSCRRASTTRRLKSSSSSRTTFSALSRSSTASSPASSLRSASAGRSTPVICSRSISFLNPPVEVVLAAEVADRLAGAGQVVELAFRHRHSHLLVDPGGLVLDAGACSTAAGAPVHRLLAVGSFGPALRPVLALRHGHHPGTASWTTCPPGADDMGATPVVDAGFAAEAVDAHHIALEHRRVEAGDLPPVGAGVGDGIEGGFSAVGRDEQYLDAVLDGHEHQRWLPGVVAGQDAHPAGGAVERPSKCGHQLVMRWRHRRPRGSRDHRSSSGRGDRYERKWRLA